MTETINGLHSCKPGNDPIVGQVQLFTIEHRKGKSGKPYIKIKRSNAENGGTPHRILNAEKTDFVDQHGNISFNLEVEASSVPTAFQQTKAAMHQQGDWPPDARYDTPEKAENVPQSPPRDQQGEDGVTEARKHLMRCCNLYNLCVAAAEKAIAPGLPNIAQTQEQFQSTLASLWIEASSRRSTDGVTWWSYVDKMPDTPVNGGKHATTAVTEPKYRSEADCTCENTDGDNPLCPVHAQ